MPSKRAQRQAVAQVIRDHHKAFLAEVLGRDAIPRAEYDRLVAKGFIDEAHEAVTADETTKAVVLGSLSASMDARIFSAMRPAAFRKAVSAHTLTPEERAAVEYAKAHTADHLTVIGERVVRKATRVLTAHERKIGRIKDRLARGIAERQRPEAIAKSLAKITGEARRDWMRVVATELHTAMEEGRASVIKSRGGEPLVYKRPQADGCRRCKALYLEKDGVTPRVFTLSALEANGTNVLRKAQEWQPVVGAVHPWCQCQIHELPAGFAFNDVGQAVHVGVEKALRVLSVQDIPVENHVC